MSPSRSAPAQNLAVYRAGQFRASDGANMGDALSFAAELVLDDVYELDRAAEPQRLSLLTLPGDHFRLTENTGVGRPGGDLHLDSLLTLMSPDGQTQEALLLVEVDQHGHAAEVYLLPVSSPASLSRAAPISRSARVNCGLSKTCAWGTVS